ncbi:MAG TPA: glycosyltransferase family 4 protein [Candidatus Bathyarchaeia archaeon]|nr:glycosyltransferase family 4 protein [Candidatus Bathyarchaeia archaeon]
MNPKSVLMIVARYPATHGHTTVIDNLCICLNKMGIRTDVGAFEFDRDPPSNTGKILLNKKKSFFAGVNNLDYDIIHIHQPRVNYYLLSVKPAKTIILHYHGASTIIHEINFKLSMMLHKKRISKIIAVSNAAVSQIKRIAGDLDPEVVYNGVDINFFKPGLSHPYQKGVPQLLFVSALRKYKNTQTIIKAMPLLLKKYPKAHLQIVGDGEEFQNLSKLIEQKGLRESVELIGNISDQKELCLRYSSCDLYLSASKIEACPVPPFEAMACGKPVVLYDIEAHREIINSSSAGIIFHSEDEVEICNKISEAYENRVQLGKMARKFAEEHDWSITCNKIVNIYKKFMK